MVYPSLAKKLPCFWRGSGLPRGLDAVSLASKRLIETSGTGYPLD